MSGIYPKGGVPCNQAYNAACGIPSKNGCEVLYYSGRCRQVVDPNQVNAIISEIGEVLKRAGYPYDCDKLDNLASAIHKMIMDQDALTRAWVLEKLSDLRDELLQLIDNNLDDLENDLNNRMDGLLFECLKGTFPASTNHTNLSTLGVGTQGGCTRIVRMPNVEPPSPDVKYETIQTRNLDDFWNTPVQNTSGKMQHITFSGSGGSMTQADSEVISPLVIQISKNGTTWTGLGGLTTAISGMVNRSYVSFPLPAGWFWRITGGFNTRSGTAVIFSQ